MVERDCNTCKHHVQGATLSDVPTRCWDCTSSHSAQIAILPYWEPEEIKGETVSDGMTEMKREEREELKVGDKVKIVRKVEYENGWENTWVQSMDDRIGMVVTIRSVNKSGVYFKEIGLGWPKGALEKVIEAGKPAEDQVWIDPLRVQIGGTHYKGFKIQPVEFCAANKLDFFQKDVIKYITRRKGDKVKRIEDLNKAKHYIDLYIQAIDKGDME